MPKIQIELSQDAYDKLKIKAKEHYQSLRGYIADHMTQFINNPTAFIKTSESPEGSTTTIKYTAPKVLTSEEKEEQQKQKFLALCKELYGADFYKKYAPDIVREYLTLTPDNTYYNFAEEAPEGRYVRTVYTMPVEKQKEYIIEMKHFLEEN